jgi:hypothetical protein
MALSDEHIPDTDLRDAILDQAVAPRVTALCNECGCPGTFTGMIRVQGQDVDHFGRIDGHWTIRMIVRRTFNPTRFLFRIQALVHRQVDTGFCGFQMTGEAMRDGSTVQVNSKGWTGLYNTTGNDNWS